MPMPKPRDNENRDSFISRCMSSSVMKQDFPDTDQRVAVCMNIWREERKDMSDSLIEAIRARGQKQTEFSYGILTADRWVQTLKDAAGLDMCYQYASKEHISFDDVLKKAARTLTYSNPDMVVQEKELVPSDFSSSLELPKNTLMVFKHVLTTPRLDRDGDILRTEGANVDPKMLLLWQHVHTLPIGKMLLVTEHTKDRLQLVSCIVDMNELSHDAAVMIDNDMGRFSHGFRALDWEPLKNEKGEEVGGFDIKSFEIMEESLVSVPSNADAESEEVILSLVEGGKLTSDLMKEVGRTIRNHMKIQVPGAEIKEGETNEDLTETRGEETGEGSDPGTPKEADPVEGKETAEEDTCNTEVADDGTVVIDVMQESTSYAPEDEKSGRAISSKNLSILKECLEDMQELVSKGYDMSRGGMAICERCISNLTLVIEDATGDETAPDKAPSITVADAMAVVASQADRKQRDKLEYILRAIRESEDRRERAEKFRKFRRS